MRQGGGGDYSIKMKKTSKLANLHVVGIYRSASLVIHLFI